METATNSEGKLRIDCWPQKQSPYDGFSFKIPVLVLAISMCAAG